jgi:hypothetical protein
MPQPREYNTEVIRELVNDSFTAEELYQLCYDKFRAVYSKFAPGTSKAGMIQHLIEYGEMHGQLAKLLSVIQEKAPHQYAVYKDKLLQGTTEAVSAPSDLPDAEIEQLKKLIAKNTRRLHALQLKAAQYGLSTPPEVTIEIEDLEAEIAELKRKLKS